MTYARAVVATFICVILSLEAHAHAAPTNVTPDWKSYQQTGNPADIVSSPTVANAIGGKIDAVNGQAQGLQIQGGTFSSPQISNGAASGLDVSLAVSTASGASKGRALDERSSTALQPQDFLSANQNVDDLLTGQIDAQPAISSAIAAGQSVTLPCGTYRIDEPFPTWSTDGLRLSGKSRNCVTVLVNFAPTSGQYNLFTLSGHYQTISDMTLTANLRWSAGSAIYSSLTFGNSYENLVFTGPFWNGIYLNKANGTHILNIFARPPYLPSDTIPNPQAGAAYAGGSFIALDGDTKSGYPAINTFIEGVTIAQYQNCIQYIAASGIYEKSVDAGGCNIGHLFSPSSGNNVNGFQGVNVLGDTSYGPNWYFSGAGGIYEIMCSACWASSSYSDSGVSFTNPNLSQVNFENSTSVNNSQFGIYSSAGFNIGWVGGAIEMNNTKIGSSNDASDVYLSAGNGTLDWVRIQNTFIGQGGVAKFYLGKTNQALYAVDASSLPSSSHVSLIGLQTYNHYTGQMNLPSNTSNFVMYANQGN